MKRDELTINGCNMIVETFKSFGELKAVTDSRVPLWRVDDVDTRDVVDEENFRKAKSFDEAQNYLIHGINEDVERMVSKVKSLQKTGKTAHTVRHSDVVGYVPIVPNAILGLPNSMMNQKKVQVKSKVVTVVYDPSVASYVSHEDVLEYGCQLINRLVNLEKAGYRIRLEGCYSSIEQYDGSRQYVMRVLLKSENQPINIKRLAFAMTHAAMQRYIKFDWMERLPGSRKLDGFGQSCSVNKDAVKNIKDYLGGNEYFIYHGRDIDDAFAEIA